MSPGAEPHPRTTFLGMNTTHLRQRLWLWVIVHVGIRDCSPRQLLKYWRFLGAFVLAAFAFGVWGLVDGDELAWLFTLITGLGVVAGIVIIRAASADMRSPVTIEARVTGFKRLWIKGQQAHNSKRYQYRVTLDDGTGNERVFRAADETHLTLDEGDLVRAQVAPRLRWIYDIEVLGRDSA